MPEFKVLVIKKTVSTKVVAVKAKNVEEAIAKAYAEADKFLNLAFTETGYKYVLGWVEDANLKKKKV